MASFDQLKWLETLVPAARTCARLWKIPSSVLLAQAAIESDWGTNKLVRQNLNYFAIPVAPVHGYTDLVDWDKSTNYAKFGNPMDCFAAHAHLLATLPMFAPAMAVLAELGPPNVNRFLIALQRCGYSDLPTYAIRLATLIREAGLYNYDLPPANPAVQ